MVADVQRIFDNWHFFSCKGYVYKPFKITGFTDYDTDH